MTVNWKPARRRFGQRTTRRIPAHLEPADPFPQLRTAPGRGRFQALFSLADIQYLVENQVFAVNIDDFQALCFLDENALIFIACFIQ